MKKKTELRLTKEDKQRLEQLKEFISNNLSRHFTIVFLASEAGVNRYKLTYGFKKVFGCSIHQFIIEARMKNAKRLLTETDLPIKKIAQLNGYSDHNNFRYAFKNFYGYTPSSLRK
jgi:AraC-like DNA-binding protein